MSENPYKRLAERLDALPNGFPPTDDGTELRLLAKLFTPEEAALAAELRLTLESPGQISERVGIESKEIAKTLKNMARRGLIAWGRSEKGIGYRLLPFVVGIYEMQAGHLDVELAQLFEAYYLNAFGQTLKAEPQVHRVIPVGESVQMDLEIRPYESATEIVDGAKAWGVVDCICRTQKALIGNPCGHPVDVCMVLSQQPSAFDDNPGIQPLTQDEALATLQRAAEAGLVHSVSNNQVGHWYICNCCTCSCGILRGIAELGIANAVARSAFLNSVDDTLCLACGDCIDYCQFDALTLNEFAQVNEVRCVGCGVCVLACPEEALGLVRRTAVDETPVPADEKQWLQDRAAARGLDLSLVL